ncbi:MAG TPA: DinB family protein [Acidobacteriaceae bacterium]|nr:DinB family protein [Acidobacteriaceae bacterium]
MFTLDGIRKLHSWTHASLRVLFNHLETLPAGGYVMEFPGFGYPSIHAQVVHLLGCEARWVRRLQLKSIGDWDPGRWPLLADARSLEREVTTQTLAYLSDLTNQQLNSKTTLHFADGSSAVRTPALVLHHVFTHAFHHKGQIVAMCRVLGHPAPDTDLNQFE